MQKMWLFGLLVIAFGSYAEEPEAPPPLDPKFDGSHAFALMASESDLFASYMPEMNDPKNHQLLYIVDAKGPNLFYLVRDADRVTVTTNRFNLERLFRGESVEVKFDVFMGDYRDGAAPVYTDIAVNFVEQQYYRPLVDLEPSGLRQTYDIIELPNRDRVLIHRIKHAPSFDHIVLVEEAKSCVTQFFTSNAVPSENELLMKLLFCGSLRPLYYNSRDFE